jgi:hypothetical protein
VVLQRKTHHLLDIAIVVRNQDLGHRTSSGKNSRLLVDTVCATVLSSNGRSSPPAAIACVALRDDSTSLEHSV